VDLSQNNYTFPVSTEFKFFDKSMPQILTIGKNGYIVATGTNNSFAFDPFITDIVARGTASRISAQVETTATDTIIKIEWRNVGINGHPAGDSLNFQAWLYKNEQQIEFHYGPSSFTYTSAATLPFVNISLLSPDFMQNYESHTITGSASTPLDDPDPATTDTLSGDIPNGTIFRFRKAALAVVHLTPGPDLSVYPNPVRDKLRIAPAGGTMSYILTDITGKVIVSGKTEGIIDTDHLPAGPFLLMLKDQKNATRSFFLSKQ
jgi:hypothetical protein